MTENITLRNGKDADLDLVESVTISLTKIVEENPDALTDLALECALPGQQKLPHSLQLKLTMLGLAKSENRQAVFKTGVKDIIEASNPTRWHEL